MAPNTYLEATQHKLEWSLWIFKEWFSWEVLWKTIPKCWLGPRLGHPAPNIFPIGVTDHSYFNSLFLKCLHFLSCGNGAKKVLKSEVGEQQTQFLWEINAVVNNQARHVFYGVGKSFKNFRKSRSKCFFSIKPELLHVGDEPGILPHRIYILDKFLLPPFFWVTTIFPKGDPALSWRLKRSASASPSFQESFKSVLTLESMLLVLSAPIVWRPQLRCWLRVLSGLWRMKKDGQLRNPHLEWTLT